MSIYITKTNKRDFVFEDDEVEFLWRRNAEGLFVEDNKGIYSMPRKKLLKVAVPVNFDDDVDLPDCGLCYEKIYPFFLAHQLKNVCCHGENFHSNCLQTWIEKKYSLQQEPTCPMCRIVIVK